MNNYTKYHYKDDFTLVENCADDDYSVPFSFCYYADGRKDKCFTAGYDGEKYVNCMPNDNGGGITVVFKDHGMAIGTLVCEKTFFVTTPHGIERHTAKCEHPIMLTFGTTHLCDTPVCGTVYRYRGEVDSIPEDFRAAILRLPREETREKALGVTRVNAEKYYLYAVQSDEPIGMEILYGGGGLVEGYESGTVTLEDGDGDGEGKTYYYVLVPKASRPWSFIIQVY